MALKAGAKLGPYEIEAPIGAGGMGEVHRARDTRLGRIVAIKVLPADLSGDTLLRQRLEREAKAISSLNHPHICTLYDVGSQDGVDFLVMEYVEGETLSSRLQKGAIPIEEALKIAVELADALHKAHRDGLIHRDLKPGNIMLTKHGLKLMDFGLAKSAVALPTAGGPNTPSTPTVSLASLSAPASRLTERGMVVGTFQYMAPEVLQGREADTDSDIFSFGCVLYEMITGRPPFQGKSQFSVLGAILDHEPDPATALRPNCPPQLGEIVRRCLAKNPGERYGCMQDIKLNLGGVTESPLKEPLPATPVSIGWKRLAWFAGGFALAAMLVIAGYLSRAPHPAQPVKSTILPPENTSFLTLGTASGPPVLSPDGARIAFTARDPAGKVMMYVRPLNSVSAEALPGTEEAMYPFWSPDSQEIGFFADGKLKRIEAKGGPPQIICEAGNGRGGSWSKNGIIVFTPGVTHPLLRVPAAGGTPQPASKFDVVLGHNSHRWPWFLPDGTHFLFWARGSRGPQGNALYIGSLGSLNSTLLMRGDSMALYASDHLLFVRDQTLMAQPFDPRRLQLAGAAVPIAESVVTNVAVNRPIFSASANGTLIYQTGGTAPGWYLAWFGRAGKEIGHLGEPGRYFTPALSPDGKLLAVTLFNDQGNSDVWIFDLLRATKTRLTFGPTVQIGPVWAADGKTIFFVSNQKGLNHIYARNADGSGNERMVLESSDASEIPSSVSSDGKYLVYERVATDRKNGFDIWALPLFGARKPFPIVQTAFNDYNPAISPDGRWMAYSSEESGRAEVFVTAFPGGGAKWQVSNNGGTVPKWRRDGRELFFLDPLDNIVSVDISTAADSIRLGSPHVLFHAPAIQNRQGPYDVTADGKKFLINTGNVNGESEPFTLVLNWPAELQK